MVDYDGEVASGTPLKTTAARAKLVRCTALAGSFG